MGSGFCAGNTLIIITMLSIKLILAHKYVIIGSLIALKQVVKHQYRQFFSCTAVQTLFFVAAKRAALIRKHLKLVIRREKKPSKIYFLFIFLSRSQNG